MTRPCATASPVARLSSTRSAKRRAVPRVSSTLPVATTRLSGATCSIRSATTVTPPAVLTVTGPGAWAAEATGPARRAPARKNAVAGSLRMGGPNVLVRKWTLRYQPPFDRARRIAPGEAPEDVADEGE